ELLGESALAGDWQMGTEKTLVQVMRGPGLEQARLIVKTAIALAAETEGRARIRDCALRYCWRRRRQASRHTAGSRKDKRLLSIVAVKANAFTSMQRIIRDTATSSA